MNKKNLYLFILLFFSIIIGGEAYSQEQKSLFRVQYVSADHIYLEVGSAGGLTVGDRLTIQRGSNVLAQVEIVFLSETSASCKILSQTGTIKPGDQAVWLRTKPIPQKVEPQQQQAKPPVAKEPLAAVSTKPRTRISGYVSAQWYHIEDTSPLKMNFDQPGMRLNLRARNLFGKAYSLRIRARSRHDQRKQSLNPSIPLNEWRNRVYEASFRYDDESSPFNYRFGRIISEKFSGIGYIDGMLVQHNYSKSLRLGLFGGTQPEWQYSGFQTSLQKYGAYFNYLHGDYNSQRFESTIAFAGEYHGSTVSREFVYFQNSYYGGKRWNFYQSAELDLNRSWRKTRTGTSVSLTNLYLYGYYHINDRISAGLSYDNRRNYLTYETRTIADNLFDEALRYGLRANVNVKLPRNYHFFSNYGLRKRQNDTQYTHSFAGGMSKYNFLQQRLSLSFLFSGFSNYFANGYNLSLRVGKTFRAGHSIFVSYGNYSYRYGTGATTTRINQWLRVNGIVQLVANFYLTEEYDYNWGADAPGHRIYTELGYRF